MGFEAIQSAIEELEGLLSSLPGEWAEIPDSDAACHRADGGWSRKQLVGHMIDSGTVNHQRFIRALAGETDFNLLYAQEVWVDLNGYQSREWNEVIAVWKAVNTHLLTVCRRIREDQAELICGRDGDPGPWTLEHRVPDYVAHLRMHVEQMKRGPWGSSYSV